MVRFSCGLLIVGICTALVGCGGPRRGSLVSHHNKVSIVLCGKFCRPDRSTKVYTLPLGTCPRKSWPMAS
jgi:hypothetical protein